MKTNEVVVFGIALRSIASVPFRLTHGVDELVPVSVHVVIRAVRSGAPVHGKVLESGPGFKRTAKKGGEIYFCFCDQEVLL